jgi:hypothetical protein
MSLARTGFVGAALILVGLASCAHSTFEGTTVEDTDDNREIVEVLQELRTAIEGRDSARMMKLISPDYFEDMGTADTSDDYGYHELQEIAPKSMEVAKEIFLSLQLHAVHVDGDKAYADVRYSSRARLQMPTGKSLWDSHKEFNRIELKRTGESGKWLIVSGL